MATGTDQPTDEQLRAAVSRIARIYLEVERGLRSPDHLKPLMGTRAYDQLRRDPMETRHPGVGPVVPADLGRIVIDRNLPRQVTATVATREFDDRWGGLVIHLQQRRDGWVVDALDRLHRRGLEAEQRPTTVASGDVTERIRIVEQERRLVQGAHGATVSRLDDLDRDLDLDDDHREQQRRELLKQADRWQSRLDELDMELDELTTTAALHRRYGSPQRATSDTDLWTRRLIESRDRVLGDEPDPSRQTAHELWNAAVVEIEAYRTRWDITDETSLLGAEPSHELQARDRQRLVTLLSEVADDLHTERDQQHGLGCQHGIGPDGTALDLGR